MPRFNLGRHRAACGLLIAGSIALSGAQQTLGTAATAQTTEAIVETHDLQPLTGLVAAPVPLQVNAAISTGQFEEPIQKPTPTPTLQPTVVVPTVVPTPAPAIYESGIASTYGEGDGFEGNLTACGQVFHTNEIQIAHRSLPCGTHVRVVDTDTGKSVDATVTDRGPYVAGRIVDLSWGAFKQLDPTGPGLLNVNLYLLDR
jgi:rare lipoprotein A (peptidoglycan hydrolase)